MSHFPVVMQMASSGTYLVKKDAWVSEWSEDINQARIFLTQSAFTRASRTINDQYRSPKFIGVVQVPVKIVEV